MAQGALYLAMFWESAWMQGNGPAIAPGKLKELDKGEVRARYINPGFVPSLTLDKIEPVLKIKERPLVERGTACGRAGLSRRPKP
jgi:hypothetical protein